MHRSLLFLCFLAPTLAFAQFEELENPGTVSAVQERAFRMHHELNISVGALPLDAFWKGYFAQVGYVYHFTDWFAWQVGRGAYVVSARTGLREQLERDFQVLPTNFEEVQFMIGSDLMWTPLYGKLAVLNRWVVHGEVYLLLGAALMKLTNAFRPGINFGGGARIFATKNISFRFDITDTLAPGTAASKNVLNVMQLTLSLAINFTATE